MRNKSFTFLVIPSGDGKTYRFNVDSFVLLAFSVFCMVFVGASLFFSYDYFAEQFDRSKLASLESENDKLSGRLTDMQSTIDELHVSYAQLVENEKAIRAIFDLPEIDDQERMLGIGGPVLFDMSDMSQAEQRAYHTEMEVDELVRLSSFETKQFKSIYERLKNKKSELDHIPSIMPCEGYLTRGYGIMPHPISGFKSLHAGLDIANRTGTPVYATAAGTVSFTGNKGRMGKTVVVDHGNGIKTMFGHLHKYTVRHGQKVERGDKIGEMGNTGYSTGTHLHYAVTHNGKSVNPFKYVLHDEMVTDHAAVY